MPPSNPTLPSGDGRRRDLPALGLVPVTPQPATDPALEELPLRQTTIEDWDRLIVNAAELAAPIFAEQQWFWGSGTGRRSPSAARIALNLRRMVHLARESPGGRSGTGRFQVDVSDGGGDVRIYLELSHLDLVDWAELDDRRARQKRVGK